MRAYDYRMLNAFVAYVCQVRRILSVSSAYNEHVTYAAVELIHVNTAPISYKHIIPADVHQRIPIYE